ncbi:hypothetical protein SPRG_13674 [Saprolegnia parasitica CBS 223.65]|uniref:Uncharacterized protein n=1 Tax=Saprolegnia parasitica (strain CBS 223.65) TaxID=695850 RepID=A0A067C485_SAPPC|nr:hypothetical protein SPRG_13674 [Saprolegnia parasitica CBS 223.65]KDO21361.1 hypothetical protein SPRG_13674 [Saprolegnia parasitica CBS 223.65]|eukprot:XP_012207917.1 hypothetical protein SPRG_13674 [Saprolegnia parasitica CBS 223.65]
MGHCAPRRKSPRSHGPHKLNLSAELLDKYSTLDATTYEAPPTGPLRVFGIMKLVQASISSGCFLTRQLYAPREIWLMDRVRLAGVDHKMRLLEVLSKELRVLEALSPPVTIANKTVFEHTLKNMAQLVHDQRAELLRPFPNLAQEPPAGSTEPAKMEKEVANALGAAQAVAVVERANAAMLETISKETLGRYSQWIESVFTQVQFLGVWLDPSYPVAATLDLGRHQDVAAALQGSPWLDSIATIATFFDEVVCELVMRDVEALLQCYLRRISQGFGAFSIDTKTLVKPSPPSSAAS